MNPALPCNPIFTFDNDGDKDVLFVNHPTDSTKSMTIPVTMVNGKLQYVEDTGAYT